MRLYGYLRASTEEQDAERSRSGLEAFAKERGQAVAAWFVENESGAKLDRPELFRLLDIAQKGDVLLVEQVDRISRLKAEDWDELKSKIMGKGVRVVALDLPTSWQLARADTDEFTDRMLEAVNGMLLDMLAATARKDYTDRRRRQAEGIAKAKAEKKYKGRPINESLHRSICKMLKEGWSYSEIQRALGCSRTTISSAKKRLSREANSAKGPRASSE